METLSFAFGMLAMVAIILIVTVIISIVKVYKQQSEIKYLQECMSNIERDLDSKIDNIEMSIYQSIEESIKNLTSYTDSRFDKLQTKFTTQGSKELLKG